MISDNEKFNMQVKPNSAFLNELKSKLPEFFDREENFDLDKFKGQLKEHNINELSDGYQLNFIGKDYARRQAGEMPSTVIVPDEKQNNGEGKDSKNLFFTGDNLEVLRHLQNNYAGKIDVIYIDPPYNTGKDGFVYPDNFEYSDEKIKEMFGIDDTQVERLKNIQGKSSHSAWLTFIYPRLCLAKKLLATNGNIFISIDDNEFANLREIMNDIFGEITFSGSYIWQRTYTPANLSKTVKQGTEYVLCYTILKNNKKFAGIKKYSSSNNGLMNQTNSYHRLIFPANKVDTNLKNGTYKKGNYGTDKYKIELVNDVQVKDGVFITKVELKGKFKWIQQKLDEEIKLGTKISIKTKSFSPSYERAEYDAEVPPSLINDKVNVGTNDDAQDSLNKLLGNSVFNNPKPVSLVKYLINFNRRKDLLILDFFAGSSTTADAVMQLNAEDGGNRKFIMVQLPEKTYTVNSDGKEVPTKGGKAAYRAGFRSIDEISRERIRRAAAKIKADNDLTLPKDFDGSFKHYRVVNPTKQILEDIEDFDPDNTTLFTDMVDSFSSRGLDVAGNATGEQTILTTWLAKDGYSFDEDIKKIDFDGYEATLVEDSRLYIINNGWSSENTEALLNKIGTHQITVQTIVLFGYSFNIADLRELEIGLKQLDSNINLLKRY